MAAIFGPLIILCLWSIAFAIREVLLVLNTVTQRSSGAVKNPASLCSVFRMAERVRRGSKDSIPTLTQAGTAAVAAAPNDPAAKPNGRARRKSRDTLSIWDAMSNGQSAAEGRELARQRRRPTRSRNSCSWQGGDANFDTPEMKAKRAALRHNVAVSAALDEWWEATDADGNGFIDREEYIELGKALYRVIIADGNETAAQKSAEDDWEEDSKGEKLMTAAHYRDAIFQLCDLWTDSLEPTEYVAFLVNLLAQMKVAGLGTALLAGTATFLEAASDTLLPPASLEAVADSTVVQGADSDTDNRVALVQGATAGEDGTTSAGADGVDVLLLQAVASDSAAPSLSSVAYAKEVLHNSPNRICHVLIEPAALAPLTKHYAETDTLLPAATTSVGSQPAAVSAAGRTSPTAGRPAVAAIAAVTALDCAPSPAQQARASNGDSASTASATTATRAYAIADAPACAHIAEAPAVNFAASMHAAPSNIPHMLQATQRPRGRSSSLVPVPPLVPRSVAIESARVSSQANRQLREPQGRLTAGDSHVPAEEPQHVLVAPPLPCTVGTESARGSSQANRQLRELQGKAVNSVKPKSNVVKPIVYGAETLTGDGCVPAEEPQHWFYGAPPLRREQGDCDASKEIAVTSGARRSRAASRELDDFLQPPPDEILSMYHVQPWAGSPSWVTRGRRQSRETL